MTTPSKKSVTRLSKELQEGALTREDIFEKSIAGLLLFFPKTAINIYILEPTTKNFKHIYPMNRHWYFSQKEKQWFFDYFSKPTNLSSPIANSIYITDRENHESAELKQLEKDRAAFDYACNDFLVLSLLTEDQSIFGFITIHNWRQKRPLIERKKSESFNLGVSNFVDTISRALENLDIHQRIESLLSDKKALKQRIQKDEEDLKRRILELTVLYDTSNSLGYSLDYKQIVNLVMESIHKVLHFDICAIFLVDFVKDGEIISRINKPLDPSFLRSVHSNIISASIPFIKKSFDPVKVSFSSHNHFIGGNIEDGHMKSFANVPLVFKEEVIGMMNICSTSKNVFTRNEMTFLHTMANQLSSHLGRIQIVKNLEKSKINSLIHSMNDGVVMIDDQDQLDIINPSACQLFKLPQGQDISTEKLLSVFESFKIPHPKKIPRTKNALFSQDLFFDDKYISLTVSPVHDIEGNKVGQVYLFRDFSELQKSNEVKKQRLNIISQVNDIIKTIDDVEKLLNVLMDFILQTANAEMGSIQLKKGKKFRTIVHSNFPDKIRRDYRFISGETISEHTANAPDICVINNYKQHPKVNQSVKIFIDNYACVPIIVQKSLIGLINIVRKSSDTPSPFSTDEINTLATITSLSGTAIQNALLYKETLDKQKTDQELKVAYDIQTKLLPASLPTLDTFDFGAISIPARQIGGDYYDFFILDDGRIGITIADIVGKGIPAGLYMAMLKSIVHTHFPRFTSPKEALIQVNKLLFKDPVINKFVPLIYGILDPIKKTFVYSNAGHEPGCIIKQDSIHSLSEGGMPLGALIDSDYDEETISIEQDDLITLFTDGIIEAKNSKGSIYGFDKFIKVVRKNKEKSAQDLTDIIFEDVKNFSTVEAHDDLTLVTVKYDSGFIFKSEEPPLKEKKIKVSSSKKFIKKIRHETELISTEMGFDDTSIFNLKLAINEAHANVIEHAYFGREDGDIIFTFRIFKDRLEILIKDFGPGMAQKTTKGEAKHLEDLEGSGLGVFLIKQFVDDVKYKHTSKVGTELYLIKYLNKRDHQIEAS